MNNFYDVSEDVRNRIMEACAKNEVEAFLITRKSNHIDDNFLYMVLTKRKNEYICWTYNNSTQSLNHGWRTTSFKDAMINFSDRLHDLDYIKESKIKSKENKKNMKDINYIRDHSYVIERDILSMPTLIEIDEVELKTLNKQNYALDGYNFIERCIFNEVAPECDEFMKGISENMEMCAIVTQAYLDNNYDLDDREFYISVAEKFQSTIHSDMILNLIELSKKLEITEIDCKNIELSYYEYSKKKRSQSELEKNSAEYTVLIGEYEIHNNYHLISPRNVYLTESVRYIEENYQNIMSSIMRKIANSINDYMYDLDTYDYKDNFSSKEEGLNEILRQLENSEEVSELLNSRFYTYSDDFKNIIENLEMLTLIQNDYKLMENTDYFKDIECTGDDLEL